MAEVPPAPGPVERVLLAVAQVPPGRVASYGDIGALAGVGPRQVGAIMREAGFNRFRRATQTPFNLVLEARP